VLSGTPNERKGNSKGRQGRGKKKGGGKNCPGVATFKKKKGLVPPPPPRGGGVSEKKDITT